MDDPIIRRRSWRWLRVKVEGLLTTPPIIVVAPDGPRIIPATRIGLALEPPTP